MATTQQVHAREINPDALNALLGRAVQDMGAALQAPLILIGDKLGLYRAMGDGTPMTAMASGEWRRRRRLRRGISASG